MPLGTDFQTMAGLKVVEAKVLCSGGHHKAAFYLAGYALEFALKAAVCKCLDMPDFFKEKQKGTAGYVGGVLEKYKTHDIKTLIVLAGLYNKLEDYKTVNSDFGLAWYHIENLNWSERCRYELAGHSDIDVNKFVEGIETQFLPWISQHW
ncbi:hypothetical protein [Runella limosa]|uniref:hypothetical protein n=1 Tax=Runella limosa TaxID=370978 RepID=UPI0003F5AA75|nr:hypothetical protein [Runella limosa]